MPRTTEEGQLAELLHRMEGLFVEYREKGTVLGVGSFFPKQFYRWWIESGRREYWQNLPLAQSLLQRLSLAAFPWRSPHLMDQYAQFNLWYREGYPSFWPIAEHVLNGEPLPLVLLNPALVDQPIPPMAPFSFYDLPAAAREAVTPWQLPDKTVYLFVALPEPVDSSVPAITMNDRTIRCARTQALGTAGVKVRRDGMTDSFFLTVGHAFRDGKGSLVEGLAYRWPRVARWSPYKKYQSLGQVVHHSTPLGANKPMYDAAVVQLDVASSFTNLVHRGVADAPPEYREPALGTIYGAVSGIVKDAAIVGALNTFGSPAMLWKNSWMLVPSGAIVRGDSGGAFILEHQEQVAGMVVGGSRIATSNKFLVQYVQDMTSIRNDFLRPAGFDLA